ncbi:glutathione S-transferase [Acidithiobacillus sp. 'AMD consortium']|jgi:glutathione S-transferase|uniref:Glutathione S-transferase n=2 Tax=Acidithiobacillus ferridurans TaxID=1232575 RepID=A0A8X8G6M4_ACIFI|nr:MULTISPECIES: glutathione S-transferase [Acidithiobacillus]MBU2716404.1 glutathione S-transferase [Acidithiobacillus ferridurans]MBU2719070.1 glutathione S-transferase [Acidithiobacillus ferridurans]MBU2723386.1 glutathione S-transferase [Acidithiobacillus ferridurans]MBU2728239.1 glutathione S-transferase [Acidithiobacillus ferridurans]MBU2733966.1 glutathione S-transferase [Acidithiobacillus ferridurans]
MAMRFYMTPGSCSTGIHILLEELDLPFEAWIVNLPAGEHHKPEYRAINPKSTIPTLVRQDGTALTEFQAIAWWLARAHPKAKLLPEYPDGEARVLEVMDYVVGTLHGQGFARIFITDTFTPNVADHAAVQARGREIVNQGFAILNDALAGLDYVTGGFSIADAALFYVEFWADRLGIPLPEHCDAHYQRLRTRPAVQRVLREEGYR